MLKFYRWFNGVELNQLTKGPELDGYIDTGFPDFMSMTDMIFKNVGDQFVSIVPKIRPAPSWDQKVYIRTFLRVSLSIFWFWFRSIAANNDFQSFFSK